MCLWGSSERHGAKNGAVVRCVFLFVCSRRCSRDRNSVTARRQLWQSRAKRSTSNRNVRNSKSSTPDAEVRRCLFFLFCCFASWRSNRRSKFKSTSVTVILVFSEAKDIFRRISWYKLWRLRRQLRWKGEFYQAEASGKRKFGRRRTDGEIRSGIEESARTFHSYRYWECCFLFFVYCGLFFGRNLLAALLFFLFANWNRNSVIVLA